MVVEGTASDDVDDPRARGLATCRLRHALQLGHPAWIVVVFARGRAGWIR